MFTKEDILARLQNGDSMDEIAKEISDVLNAAETQYQEETIKANAEKIEAERVVNAKRAIVNDMLDCLCDYLVTAGESDFIEDLKEIDTDKLIEMLDGLIEMAKSLEKLKDLQFPFNELHKAATINPKVNKIAVDENFLKNLWL